MDKALKRTTDFVGEYNTQIIQQHLERIQRMPDANRIFKRIASAPDMEQLMDYLAEVRYALVFAGLGFDVEIEPLGKKGPDLQISRNGHQAVVEVKRFRKIYPGPPELDLSSPSATLSTYGNIKRDIRKAFNKILDKFTQVGNFESIIAIWNDDEDMEEREVATAVDDIRKDGCENRLTLPQGLSFVLYGSKWVRAGDNKQLYCFPIRAQGSHQLLWQQELNTSTVSELVRCAIAQV